MNVEDERLEIELNCIWGGQYGVVVEGVGMWLFKVKGVVGWE